MKGREIMKLMSKILSGIIIAALLTSTPAAALTSETKNVPPISTRFSADYDLDFPFSVEYDINYDTVQINDERISDELEFSVIFNIKPELQDTQLKSLFISDFSTGEAVYYNQTPENNTFEVSDFQVYKTYKYWFETDDAEYYGNFTNGFEDNHIFFSYFCNINDKHNINSRTFLSIEQESNNSILTANNFDFWGGAMAGGEISSSWDTDWYKVDFTQAGYYDIVLAVPQGINTDYNFRLCAYTGPTTNPYTIISGISSGNGISETGRIYISSPSELYIEVYGATANDYSTGMYNLYVS